MRPEILWVTVNSTFSIEDTSKVAFIDANESCEDGVRNVWILTKELDLSGKLQPWNFWVYSEPTFKPVWIRYRLSTSMYKINANQAPTQYLGTEEEIPIVIDAESICRLAGDKTFQANYSEDVTHSIYPIWYCHQPNSSVKTNLLTYFLQISNAQKNNECKEDIIDPDLGPFKLDKSTLKLQSFPNRAIFKYTSIENLNFAFRLRESYHWLPSDFKIKVDGTVKILSRIHNLPARLKNAHVYNNIAKVFQGMLPMFSKLNIYTKGVEVDLQVIVRVTSYSILPEQTYKDYWHYEGQTENIIAVSHYCLQKDDGLNGGNFKFRPTYIPTYINKTETDKEAEFKEGFAIAYSNSIPSKFSTIKNISKQEKRQTVLTFLIIDPLLPLVTTKLFCSTSLICKILSKWGDILGKVLPKPIIKIIISYLPYTWINLANEKRHRKMIKDVMNITKTCWMYVFYI